MANDTPAIPVHVECVSACQRYPLHAIPGPEILQRCEYECRQAEALTNSGRFVPHMQMDRADIVEYHFRGQMQRFPADVRFLENGIDTILFRYYWVTGLLQEEGAPYPLEPTIQDKIAAQANAPKKDRKPLIEIPIQCWDGNYGFYRFAFAGKCDRLAKEMFLNRQATRDFLYISSFFSLEFFKGRAGYDESTYPSRLPAFQIEDYIYFELQTRCSFAVETCAALLEIPCEADREICRECLKEYYPSFFATPFILSRILLVRQCVHEAKLALDNLPFREDYVRYCCLNGSEARDLTAFKFRVISSTYKLILQNIFSLEQKNRRMPSPSLCAVPEADLRVCQEDLRRFLTGMKAPIDIVSYAVPGQRTPLAFCNPRHPHVADILKELAEACTCFSSIQNYQNQIRSKKGANRWRGLLKAVYEDIRAALPKGDCYMPMGKNPG